MATLATDRAPISYRTSQPFFVRLAWIMAAIIVIGFGQNAAMGRVDIPAAPIWVHAHGVLMLGWLALLITQNRLAAAGNLTLHRTLGRAGALLALAIVGLAGFTGVMALVLHRFPPFFTPAYFLALTSVEAVAFGALVLGGIVRRADTETHRRLIMGGTIILLEPAFGRLLPMPVLGGETGEWIAMLIQLGFVGAIAVHDRRTLSQVHRATAVVAAIVVASHVAVTLAARSGTVIALADRIMGQG